MVEQVTEGEPAVVTIAPLSRNAIRGTVGVIAATSATPGVVAVFQREPHHNARYFLAGAFVVLASFVTLIVGLRWVTRHADRRFAGTCLAVMMVAGAVGISGLVGSERLHWWLSKNKFDAIADGMPLPCDPDEPCRVGWWNLTGIDRDDRVTIFWFVEKDGLSGCYNGRGLARPRDRTIDEAAARAAIDETARRELSITSRADGWYLLCVTS